METDRAFLNTKFKASGPTKFNDNGLLRGAKFKTNEPHGAVFGTQGPAAERKILTRRKILTEREILKFKDASAR